MTMTHTIITGLLWFSAIGCGLIAGIYFAFSTFIMTALSRIDQAAGISAMNSINTVILKSLFIPMFLGTSLASLVLAGIALLRWGDSGTLAMLSGGVIYVVGMFIVTMMFNVPLNNALAAVDPDSSAGVDVWARYLRDWTFWNHVRTTACTAACALFTAAIAVR
jgi:uncharacterized membrane protein